jgi:hypothetical protein
MGHGAIAPSGSPPQKAAVPAVRFERRENLRDDVDFDKLFRRPDERPKGPAQNKN